MIINDDLGKKIFVQYLFSYYSCLRLIIVESGSLIITKSNSEHFDGLDIEPTDFPLHP